MINNYKTNKLFRRSLMSVLMAVLCLFTFNSVKAQTCTTIYSTSFDSSSTSPVGATGWTIGTISLTGSMGWASASSYPTGFSPKSGVGMAMADDYNWSSGAVAYMATPAFNLSAAGSSGIGFNFWFLRHAYNPGYSGTIMQVYANTSPNMTGSPVLLGTYNCLSSVATANQPIVSTPGWYQYGTTIPTSMRSSATYIIFKVTGDWWNNLFVDDFTLTQYAPQTYQGLTVTQPTTAVMSSGLPNQVIIGIPVATKGLDTTNIEVSSFSFNTTGTFATTNLDSAKVFYTGSSKIFSPINKFGTSVASPSGPFSITGSRFLNNVGGNCSGNDTSWFWLAYDINPSASNTVVNALCTSVTINGTPTTPAVVTNPGAGRIISAPLNGVYTINPSGSGATNYVSFTAALTDLFNVGVAGPVTFNVAAGTYSGQVIVPSTAIPGLSSVNKVVFDGGAGNAATRILTASVGSSATLLLDGCKYFTFKNLTINNTFSGSAVGVAIIGNTSSNNGSNNVIKNCVVNLPNVSTSTAYGISVTGTAGGLGQTAMRCDSVIIDSNTITGAGGQGPYYGINVYGSSNSLYNSGIQVTGNTVNAYYMGIILYYNYNPINASYNTLNMSPSYGYYGVYAYYNQHSNLTTSSTFIGNKVTNFGGYGLYLYFGGSGGTATAPAKVYNNVLNNGTNLSYGYYGIYLYNTGYSEVLHNTVRMVYPGTSTQYSCFYNTASSNVIVKNNVFAVMSTAGTTVPAYFATSPNTGNVNYNLYYNGANSTLVYRNSIFNSSNFRTSVAGGDTSFNTSTSPYVSTTNFNLINGCIGKGFPFNSSVPVDITGFTRNTPPDLGAYEFQGGAALDLTLDKLITPIAPITLGTQDVVFRVKNLGNTTVTSFDASYTLNGGSPVTQGWTGTLNSCDTVSVTFTSFQQITLSNSNAIKFYTASPNFSTDPDRTNDTISVTYLAPMIGNYTINPLAPVSATNFQTFAAADVALNASGISGPVNFTVAAGTYTSRIIMTGPVIGASTVNDITFDGVVASSRIIASSQAAQSVVQFNNSKYVTFKNFTINNTNTGSCSGVGINSSNVTLKNNIINMTATSTTTTSYGIDIIASATGYGSNACAFDSIAIDSNTINGGYYGIQLYGNTSGIAGCYFIKYRWNNIIGSYYSGIYHYYGNGGAEFIGNQISMNAVNTSNQYGIYFYGYSSTSANPPTPNRFVGNVLNNTSYMGMYIQYPYGSSTVPSQIYNNMILGGFRYSTQAYGINLYNTAYTNVYHNTVNMDHPNTTSTSYSAFYSSGTTTVNVKNNIFMVTGAGGTANCAYFGTAPSGNIVNYNVYYNTANTNIIYRGAQYTNLNYKTTSAGGDSSSYGLPTFVNFATRNLHFANGCTNRGVDLTTFVPNDFEGDIRSTTPNIGADEYVGGASNDIAIDALLSPVYPIVAGTNTVTARVRNVGSNSVSSFDLTYSINGGTPATTSWFGTLNACDTVSISIPTTFNIVAGTVYNLKVYTSNPNFSTDPNRGNDTLATQVATPMNGSYTIGATLSDFTTFNAAIAAMQSRGVDGPVVFNVKTGTYVESVNMTNAIGVSAINNITFQSLANHRDSVIIAPIASAPYIWQFSSASFITLNKITLRSTTTSSAQNGINISGASSFDTITDSKIDMAVQSSYTNYAVYGTGLNSSCNGMTFKNNIINGSYYGVYVYGTTNTLPSRFWNFTFDNNTLANTYNYGFYSYYSQGINFRNNNITTSSLYSGQLYYFMYADSLTITGNKFNLLNNATMYLGYYSYNGNGITGRRGLVANNSFVGGGTGGTTLYMGYQSSNLDYVNNSINIFSTSQAAYVYNSGSNGLVFKNNIFSNRTSGSAAYFSAIPTASTALMDYNNYYSNGGSITSGTSVQSTIQAWRSVCNCEKNGLTYRPAMTSLTDNTPNPNDTAVWVLNGRGEFLPYLTTDINGNARPTNIVDGAPDLGAYNVNPGTSTLAPRAVASPAVPIAGTTQVFTISTDTVASIVWDAFTTPPSTIAVRQYSGAKPKLIGSSITNYPYFYTDIQAAAGTYLYDVKVNYRNNWLGTLYTTFGFTEDNLRLANKETSMAWATNSGSTVDTTLNILSATSMFNITNLFTASDMFNPLPVKLTTFNGSLLNADAKLTWTTASEINSSMFVVERSIDGKNFTAITNVKAAGNSSSLKSYNHLDKGIITLLNSAGTIYYRLKMVDLDGSFGYSKTIEIKTIENTKEKVTVTPNPFTTDLTINVETVNNANGTIEISDINGRVIISQNIEVVKGSSTITVNSVDKLKQGIYFVRYSTETGTQVFKMLKN